LLPTPLKGILNLDFYSLIPPPWCHRIPPLPSPGWTLFRVRALIQKPPFYDLPIWLGPPSFGPKTRTILRPKILLSFDSFLPYPSSWRFLLACRGRGRRVFVFPSFKERESPPLQSPSFFFLYSHVPVVVPNVPSHLKNDTTGQTCSGGAVFFPRTVDSFAESPNCAGHTGRPSLSENPKGVVLSGFSLKSPHYLFVPFILGCAPLEIFQFPAGIFKFPLSPVPAPLSPFCPPPI